MEAHSSCNGMQGLAFSYDARKLFFVKILDGPQRVSCYARASCGLSEEKGYLMTFDSLRAQAWNCLRKLTYASVSDKSFPGIASYGGRSALKIVLNHSLL